MKIHLSIFCFALMTSSQLFAAVTANQSSGQNDIMVNFTPSSSNDGVYGFVSTSLGGATLGSGRLQPGLDLKPFSTGSRIEKIKEYTSTSLGACYSPFFTTYSNDSLNSLDTTQMSLSMHLGCEESRKFQAIRFGSVQCSAATMCKDYLDTNSAVDQLLEEVVAHDYGKNAILNNALDMERLELLKKFAANKFQVPTESCVPRFEINNTNCRDQAAMEGIFDEAQGKCPAGTSGCYSAADSVNKLSSYKEFKSQNEKKGMNDFFTYRIQEISKKQLEQDSKKIDELSKLVVSSTFKKLTAEKQAEKFLKTIGEDSFGHIKDPILGHVLPKGIIKSPGKNAAFKEIVTLYSKPGLTPEAFIAEFESYRKKRAAAIFSSKSTCTSVPTAAAICRDVFKLATGKSVPKTSEAVDNHSSTFTDSAGIVKEKLERSLGTILNSADVETLINAKRCKAFDLASYFENKGSDKNIVEGSGGEDGYLESDVRPGEERDSILNHYGGPVSSGGSRAKEGEVEDFDDNGSMGSNLAEAIGGTSQFSNAAAANSFNNAYNQNSFDSFADRDTTPRTNEALESDKTEDQAKENSDSAAPAKDNMNEFLMKRLAAAEENLEKLKAENASAEAERENQKKIAEEAALIKDLKSQIADLKSANEKAPESRAATVVPAETSRPQTQASYSGGFSSGALSSLRNNDSPAPAPVAASESFDNSRASASASSPASAASRSIASSAVLTTNSGEGRAVAASGVVLTTVDGMSAEKANQTISSRILELNGTPFLIEEGGLVKEIIPVVKDGKVLLDENGKPIFEKVLKGKVSDKKFAKIKERLNRAPASITTPADLRRYQEEELGRERAEYLKLRNLTNKVVNP